MVRTWTEDIASVGIKSSREIDVVGVSVSIRELRDRRDECRHNRQMPKDPDDVPIHDSITSGSSPMSSSDTQHHPRWSRLNEEYNLETPVLKDETLKYVSVLEWLGHGRASLEYCVALVPDDKMRLHVRLDATLERTHSYHSSDFRSETMPSAIVTLL